MIHRERCRASDWNCTVLPSEAIPYDFEEHKYRFRWSKNWNKWIILRI